MFEIGNVRFRPLTRDDLPLLEKWENRHECTLYARGKPLVFKNMDDIEEEYEEYQEDDNKHRFIIELIEDEKTIGIATYDDESNLVRNASIGTYIGDQSYWDKGLGKHITLGLCEILFYHLRYDRLYAWSSSINKRAHKVLESFDFQKSGRARKRGYLFGKRIDWVMYDLLREEYMSKREDHLDTYLEDKGDYIKNFCRLGKPNQK